MVFHIGTHQEAASVDGMDGALAIGEQENGQDVSDKKDDDNKAEKEITPDEMQVNNNLEYFNECQCTDLSNKMLARGNPSFCYI